MPVPGETQGCSAANLLLLELFFRQFLGNYSEVDEHGMLYAFHQSQTQL